MHIVHLTTEFAPIAKVGGLADVVAALSKTVMEMGETVEVILPFYDHIDKKELKNLKIARENVSSYAEIDACNNTVWSAEYQGVSLLLISPYEKSDYFKRGTIYGEKDDLLRFTYFVQTAMNYLLKKETSLDILHLHDWLTTIAAPLYYEKYQSLGLKIGGIVTTIHNMKYQGVCSPETLKPMGIQTNHQLRRDKLQDHSNPAKINLLKGGLVYSDFLTTVSPTYAEEIQGKEGFGLGAVLAQRKEKLHPILNGIDTDYWNPETDPLIERNYQGSGRHLDGVKEAKLENRRALCAKVKMRYDPTTPLFTCISRIAEQKGPEMIHFGIEYILEKGGHFILLGSSPEPQLKKRFESLAEKHRENPHAYFHFLFDETLAHLTYAAADAILIPSLFEPCGLTQMIALRYGTLPIVHQVGGLNDTVFDIDNEAIAKTKRNGYTFDFPSNECLQRAIDRAFKHHKNDLEKWLTMQKNGLENEWGWKRPAQDYLDLYRSTHASKPA